MPAHFVLKRFMPGFEEYGDLYEAIKTGKKTVEYRDATEYWANRLLSKWALRNYEANLKFPLGPNVTITYSGDGLKHTECTFRVGYTQGPTLHATIWKIIWLQDSSQFEVHIKDVTED